MFKSNISHVSHERVVEPYFFQHKQSVETEEEVRLKTKQEYKEVHKSIHPPVEGMEVQACAVRETVEPTEGAAAGDRIRYVQYTDLMFFSPITPYQRARAALCRYKGVDPGGLGRVIIEARERDVEKIAKQEVASELYDTARTGLRGRKVHGHEVRLDAYDSMMSVALRIGVPSGGIKSVPRIISAGVEPHFYLSSEAERSMIEDSKHLSNLLALSSKFEWTGDDILSLLESKRYAIEKKKDDFWWELGLEKIKEVERAYYGDVLPIPEGLMKPLMEQPSISMEKARKILREFKKLVNERNLDERIIKSFVKMLDIAITPK